MGVALTGILSELTRLAQLAAGMYPIYFVHLVLIFALFLYAPYSKFAHLAYRTVAVASAGPWRSKVVRSTLDCGGRAALDRVNHYEVSPGALEDEAQTAERWRESCRSCAPPRRGRDRPFTH